MLKHLKQETKMMTRSEFSKSEIESDRELERKREREIERERKRERGLSR